MPDKKKDRYIPSIRSVRSAAQSLPDADTCTTDTYDVPFQDDRVIEFRKIKFKSKEGKQSTWIYDGKVIVR